MGYNQECYVDFVCKQIQQLVTELPSCLAFLSNMYEGNIPKSGSNVRFARLSIGEKLY